MINEFSSIDKKANIANNVKIGPFCFIGKNVNIGENCHIHNHVSLTGNVNILDFSANCYKKCTKYKHRKPWKIGFVG